MSMKIKLNRGPLANKRYVVNDSSCHRYEVLKPVPVHYWEINTYPDTIEDPQRGDYQRSNVTLKDGTVVFEWMGWYGR